MSDPTAADSALFETTGMTALGVGPMMAPAARFRRFPGPAPAGGNGVLGIVALDGVISPDGKVSELEILASNNPTLNQAAVQWAGHVQTMTPAPQNGSTPQSRQVILIFESLGN